MADSTDLTRPPTISTESILDSLTAKMTKALTRAQTSSQSAIIDSPTVPISIKLDGSNYALWS